MGWFSDMDSTEKGLALASAAGIGLGLTGVAMASTANARITSTNKRVTRLEGRVDQCETSLGISAAQSRAAARSAEDARDSERWIEGRSWRGSGRRGNF